MLSYSTWRAAARIPWVRENLEGIRFLRTMLYFLIALGRSGRYRDFGWALRAFLEMSLSLARYCRRETTGTLARLLEIPWFREHRRELVGVIRAHARILAAIERARRSGSPNTLDAAASRDVEVFVDSLKVLLSFDEADEARIRELIDRPGALDRVLRQALTALAS